MINVMVNGLPGNMASEAARHIDSDDDFNLLSLALTGPGMPRACKIGETKIDLVRPGECRKLMFSLDPFITVDYTSPDSANANCDFYCENDLPFVMGTTGGDRDALEQRVRDSNTVAVIAPNMGKQIVVFQAMMQYAAENFPNAFKGYSLDITESHQKRKEDTSGTAKAMIKYFNQLGIPFNKDQINMIREPVVQLEMGIPEEYLGGHGWHTYTLRDETGNILFQHTHNVNGRGIYGAGTLDPVRFVDRKKRAGEKGKVYSMIDVLSEG
jgi:4-hydroxy-tetrahydrodipicolinate reductase